MSNELKEALKVLRVPFNKQVYNLPISHYEQLCCEMGSPKVLSRIRTILLCSKDDKTKSKTRVLINKLTTLTEGEKAFPECECGFVIMEDYESCPVCGKQFYKGKNCYYKDGSQCTLDEEECKWKNYKECGKL